LRPEHGFVVGEGRDRGETGTRHGTDHVAKVLD
jgi:hypothetical protein